MGLDGKVKHFRQVKLVKVAVITSTSSSVSNFDGMQIEKKAIEEESREKEMEREKAKNFSIQFEFRY
jgi:hypothetical protein